MDNLGTFKGCIGVLRGLELAWILQYIRVKKHKHNLGGSK